MQIKRYMEYSEGKTGMFRMDINEDIDVRERGMLGEAPEYDVGASKRHFLRSWCNKPRLWKKAQWPSLKWKQTGQPWHDL